MELLKKYSLPIIVLAILAPIAVNFLIQIPAFTIIVGEDVDWLSFWGDYLGALISAGVAFVILWIQYDQNTKENARNRKLQLNSMQYQFEKDRLADIVRTSAKLISAIDSTLAFGICPTAFKNPKESLIEVNRMRADIFNSYNELSLLWDSSKMSSDLRKDIHDLVSEYDKALQDIANILLMLLDTPSLRIQNIVAIKDRSKVLTPSMIKVIEDYCNKSFVVGQNPNDDYWIITKRRIEGVGDFSLRLHDKIEEYIRSEEIRIRRTLCESVDSDVIL